MTLSREKRTQRKKSRIHRLINRACRINIIKLLKRLAGDVSDLPFSCTNKMVENQPAAHSATEFPIAEADRNVPEVDCSVPEAKVFVQGPQPESLITSIAVDDAAAADGAIGAAPAFFDACLNEAECGPEASDAALAVDAAAENLPSEDIIITPYGTFSKYKQESLLEYYGIEEDGVSGQPAIVVTNAREIISQTANRAAGIMISVFALCGRILNIISSRLDRGMTVLAVQIKRGAGLVAARIPEAFCLKLYRFAAIATDTLLDGIEKFDKGIGKIDDYLTAIEAKAADIAGKAKKRILRVVRAALVGIYNLLTLMSQNWQRLVEFTDNNRRKCAACATCLLAVMIASAVFAGSISAYEYAYNGKVLGIVKNQNDVYATVDVIGDKLAKAYDANIVISKEENISFKKVYGLDLKIDNREEVLNSFTYLKDMEVMAAAITVDGRHVAVMDNKKNAQAILDEIQNKYVRKSDKIKYDKIGFAEDVQIEEVDTKLGNLQEKEAVMEYMMTGAVEKKIHVVQSGQTFSGIAGSYGIKQSQLKSSNPDVDPDRLQIGQELVLTAVVPVVTVQTVETAEYMAAIPYDIQYENTEAKYKGEQSVKNKGVNGKKQVVAQIVRNNGIEVERTELSTTVIAEPVAQVVLVGTKKLPPLIGTGSFITPVRGKITSRFGTRWGRMHEGVDFGAPTGTHVAAADGGTVIYSGWDGAYGNVIRINHGGGKVSVYAHLSKMMVKKGTKVYKGQHIGNVGNTGRSTGPHLHFEIRVNGVPKNPLNYL